MELTATQQKYFADWLKRSLPSDSLGKLTASLQDAQVNLTSNQIDAALFAFKSPLSKGTILADEVELGKTIPAQRAEITVASAERNNNFFEEEMEKLDNWSEDVKAGLEKELCDLDAEIKLRKSESKRTSRLDEKVRLQRLIKDLEKRRSEKRLNLYQAQDEVDEKKETLLAKVESMPTQKIEQTKLITFHWRII